jgi:hypothetical protein
VGAIIWYSLYLMKLEEIMIIHLFNVTSLLLICFINSRIMILYNRVGFVSCWFAVSKIKYVYNRWGWWGMHHSKELIVFTSLNLRRGYRCYGRIISTYHDNNNNLHQLMSTPATQNNISKREDLQAVHSLTLNRTTKLWRLPCLKILSSCFLCSEDCKFTPTSHVVSILNLPRI